MTDDDKLAFLPPEPTAPEPAPEPTPPEPVLETPATEPRIDNPYVPVADYEAAPPATASTVIKLWAGGEHRNAMNLADALNLRGDDLALVRATCPGWDELRGQ